MNVIKNAFADGKWIAGGQVDFVAADSAMQPNQYGQVSGYVRMNQQKMDFINADGTVRSSSAEPGPKPLLFLVVKRDEAWELGDIGTPEGSK
ncbi:hypothetical protein GCM10023063_33810 [Arthrobacter methylotrophus]|uniref:Uncharacterized protein n=1 Tax=Arthrobacter methylotrophus TaxID=121291 RepID=A0ABV5UKG0_9MICC